MMNILKNKRIVSSALILLSLILVLFCAGLRINRAAANLIGLGGALMDGADFYEDASGGGDGLAQTSAAVLRSISDGRFSGFDALFDSLRLERLIIALADDLGTDSETVLTAILLLLFIMYFLAMVFFGAAAGVYTWQGRPRKNYTVIYTALLLVYIVVLFILQANAYGLARVTIVPFLALIAAAAACYIQGFRFSGAGSSPNQRKSPALPAALRSLGGSNRGKSLCLVCRGGYQDGKVYRIGNKTVIGRNPDCNIQYPANYPSISRYHAILRMENGRLFLCDLSSTGTALKRLGSVLPKGSCVPVGVGDVFYLGAQRNRFEIIAR